MQNQGQSVRPGVVVGRTRRKFRFIRLLLAAFVFLALLLQSRALAGVGDGAAGQPSAAEASAEYLLRELPGVPDALREAVLAGRKDEALRMTRELADHDAAQRPFWLLLEGVVLQQAEDHVHALNSFARAEALASEASSPWLHKLRFARAASHRALGQWKEVEEVFEAETDRLRSGGRQQDLASVVLAFADESSTPKENAPPGAGLDYARARALYQQVLAMEVPADAREYSLWRLGFCAREGGDWNGAIQAWESWLGEWDPAWQAARGATRARPASAVPERVFDVRLAHARAIQDGAGDAARAARSFEDLEALLRGYLAGEGLLSTKF